LGARDLWIWMAAMIAAPVVVLGAAILTPVGPHRLGPVDNARAVTRYAGVNYVSTLLSAAPFVILPLVVFASVDADDNGVFYLPWQIASMLFLVPGLIGRALLLDAREEIVQFQQQAKSALLASALFGALVVVGAAVAIPLFPLAYGEAYSDAGPVLVALCLAMVPYGVTSTALTVARVRADTSATYLLAATLTLLVLLPCSIWTPDQGTTGATLAWMFGHTACAIPAAIYLRRKATG
jgi:O-antigen/teichoic acid export membrane protein